MKTLSIKGSVSSGKGEGAKFIQLSWVKERITEKLGFTPYPGTLNLKLAKEEIRRRGLLENTKAIEISPAEGFSRGKCFKAKLTDDLDCAVIIPEVPNYPEDVIEIMAPTNLRDKLNLRNGDSVEIKILLE
ncbi:CTP-dependent riboflavin kinase [Candidatus Bathyarchaeota archaeon]|nr:CTP-dependent riboflavin kinase [Candidatus Bathyarchaeota archaeon]MCK4482576.1 CTP-dependent riboflavin kinase [Candidatus Bathyarchaeota archaeon]